MLTGSEGDYSDETRIVSPAEAENAIRKYCITRRRAHLPIALCLSPSSPHFESILPSSPAVSSSMLMIWCDLCKPDSLCSLARSFFTQQHPSNVPVWLNTEEEANEKK